MFKNKGKLRKKLNIMETGKIPALKPTKARTETGHNGDWKKWMVKNQWKQNRNWT